MEHSRKTNRRHFLSGRSAADALADTVAHALDRPDEPSASGTYRETHLMRIGRRAMACQFELLINASLYLHAAQTALGALDLIDELETQLTVYRETSEVCHLNRTASLGPVRVEAGLFRLVEDSLRIHAETEGAFDITSGPLSKVWGFFRRAGAIPAQVDLLAALECVGSRHVRLDPTMQTVQFLRPGMELNFGAIGKGYALDCAAARLAAEGIEQFLIHGGQSSVLARGNQSRNGDARVDWTVGIGDPLRPGKRMAEIRLHDRGLSTSGSGTQFFRHGGKRYGHILDPRTGQPAEGILSVTVTAPTAAEADALSTAFYVLGVEAALDYCQSRPQIGVVLVFVSAEGHGVELATCGIVAEDITFDP